MNYRIEAFEILLNEDCLLQRYYPLIPYKRILLEKLTNIHCYSKSECVAFPDEVMFEIGLPNLEQINLFKRFLVMYDVKDSKLRDINEVTNNLAEACAFRELYLLPGVKSTRARLYYDSGYFSLTKIASSRPEQIIKDTFELINSKGLNLKVPTLKEVRTHIAVAKVLVDFNVY